MRIETGLAVIASVPQMSVSGEMSQQGKHTFSAQFERLTQLNHELLLDLLCTSHLSGELGVGDWGSPKKFIPNNPQAEPPLLCPI